MTLPGLGTLLAAMAAVAALLAATVAVSDGGAACCIDVVHDPEFGGTATTNERKRDRQGHETHRSDKHDSHSMFQLEPKCMALSRYPFRFEARHAGSGNEILAGATIWASKIFHGACLQEQIAKDKPMFLFWQYPSGLIEQGCDK